MKKTLYAKVILYITILCFAFGPTLKAQELNRRLTIDTRSITYEELLNQIAKEYDVKFVYDPNTIPKGTVQKNIRDQTLVSILNEAGLRAVEKDGSVILSPLKPEVKQQDKLIGNVKDENGQNFSGVTISLKGTSIGTVTDVNGNFVLPVDGGEVIQVNYVGYKTQEIAFKRGQPLSIFLEPDESELAEVVVVGYGTQKKASVIGAISTIKPQVLQSNQTRSISNSLAGQVAGVVAVQRSGEPGYDNSDFWIRGINTFGANASPLVLIDGVERSLNNISPEEIESFSILKDATATAVYGVRGANGVILVQTKRGVRGKPRVTLKSDYGISNPTKLPEFVNSSKYMEVVNIANELSGMGHLYSEEQIRRTKSDYDQDLYPDVNWIDAVTEPNAGNGRISIDVNGGGERLRYSLVGSYFYEQGMMVTDQTQNYDSKLRLKKYNVRNNVDLDLTGSTKVAVNIGGYITERNAPGVGISTILSRSMDTPPNYHPTLYSNGQIPKVAARYNPWADATQTGYQRRFESNIETSINLIQDFGKVNEVFDGLTGSVLAAFDSFNTHSQNRTKTPRSFYATGRTEEGDLITTNIEQGQEFLNYSRSSGGNRTLYFEGRLNYNRTFASQHTLDGLFLFNLRDHVIQDAGSSILSLPYRNMGIAGRSAYSFDDRYFAEFNFGYNGSENFKEGYRFGFFPSFALGWYISNESFFETLLPVVSKLKLRASWGLVGNDQIVNNRRFAYLSTIEQTGGYSFGFTNNFSYPTGWREGDFGIDNMTWETAEKKNIGIELDLFNAIAIQVDLFEENRSDIFMQRKTIPELAGYNIMPYANFGKVNNKGVEVEMMVNHQFNPDWFLSARGTFTYAKNKIIEYDEPESLKITSRARTGQSLNQHYGLIAEGLYSFSDFSDESKGILAEGLATPMFGPVKPGDIKYRDLNGDQVIDSYDESPIGSPHVPEVIVGFGFNTRFKRFDFGVFFQGASNFTNMLHGATLVPGSGGGGVGNIYANIDDRWTPENPSSNVIWPRLSNIESANNMRYSTWWIVDASYLRLKNLEVGYSITTSKWLEKAYVKNARVFARGSNLLTFSHFTMWDPEIGSQNGLKYPLQRIYTAGIEISF